MDDRAVRTAVPEGSSLHQHRMRRRWIDLHGLIKVRNCNVVGSRRSPGLEPDKFKLCSEPEIDRGFSDKSVFGDHIRMAR